MTLSPLLAAVHAWLSEATPRAVVAEVPVAPDSDQATDWLIDELSKAPYQAARPTLFDRASKAFTDWLDSLTVGDGNWAPTVLYAVLIVLIAAAVTAAIVVYGLPRLNRKSRHDDLLFGDAEYRTAAQLRDAAEQAAAREDFADAIADMFRSIAKGLAERTLVSMTPGTTAHGFAVQAARVLPDHRAEFENSADIFDLVRYARKPAIRQQYEQLRALEARLRATKPDLAEVVQ